MHVGQSVGTQSLTAIELISLTASTVKLQCGNSNSLTIISVTVVLYNYYSNEDMTQIIYEL